MISAGHLTARPVAHGRVESRPAFASSGDYTIDVGGARPTRLRLGRNVGTTGAAPLALLLHGAGGDADQGLRLLEPFSGDAGWIVLAPASTSYTWDVLVDALGADVARIDSALAWVFERFDVDPLRVAIGGFSDGASYALTLGIGNGELFGRVLALSPGFVAPIARRGQPRVFISHGTGDTVLPIDRCSRRIVPQLRRAGIDVAYHEFPGRHEIPAEIARRAVAFASAPA